MERICSQRAQTLSFFRVDPPEWTEFKKANGKSQKFVVKLPSLSDSLKFNIPIHTSVARRSFQLYKRILITKY